MFRPKIETSFEIRQSAELDKEMGYDILTGYSNIVYSSCVCWSESQGFSIRSKRLFRLGSVGKTRAKAIPE